MKALKTLALLAGLVLPFLATAQVTGITNTPDPRQQAILLRNQGYTIVAQNPNQLRNTTTSNGAGGEGWCWRVSHVAAVPCTSLVGVYANYTSSGNNGEASPPNTNTIQFKGAWELNDGGSKTTQTGSRYAMTFGGGQLRTVTIPPGGIAFSDPATGVQLSTGSYFWERSWVMAPFPGGLIPVDGSTLGGTTNDGVNNGDGATNSDLVDSGTIGSSIDTQVYSASLILAKTTTFQPSVALAACDSIANGTFDGGMRINEGGFVERAVCNQTGLNYSDTAVPYCGFAKFSKPGETLANFAALPNSNYRRILSSFATTVVCNEGHNDLGGVTATIEANMVTVAKYYCAQGIHVIWCTQTPSTQSTDYFATASNQTKGANEAQRVTLNTYMRDGSSSGFVAQVGYGSLLSIFDVSALLEVNSSNVLTLNGGYWPAALSASDATGTFTAGTTSTTLIDSGKTPTANQFKGYSITDTTRSTSSVPVASAITWNNATGTFSPYTSLSGATSGDSYLIWRPWTVDGIHPSTYCHYILSQSFPLSAIAGLPPQDIYARTFGQAGWSLDERLKQAAVNNYAFAH